MSGTPAGWLARPLRPLAIALIAGIAGLIVHGALMMGKGALGILPGFQPFEDPRWRQRWRWPSVGRLMEAS